MVRTEWSRRCANTPGPGQHPMEVLTVSNRNCSVDGCGRVEPLVRGLCHMHYARMRAHGSTDCPRPTPWQRFIRSVDQNGPVAKHRPDLGPCWIWQRTRKANGYSEFFAAGKQVLGHRFAYEQVIGPIPDGLVLDHFACDNGAGGCVNPHHVRPVTIRENALRSESAAALNAAKTECKWGHEFTPENTWVRPKGSRECIKCMRRREAEYRERLREMGAYEVRGE